MEFCILAGKRISLRAIALLKVVLSLNLLLTHSAQAASACPKLYAEIFEYSHPAWKVLQDARAKLIELDEKFSDASHFTDDEIKKMQKVEDLQNLTKDEFASYYRNEIGLLRKQVEIQLRAHEAYQIVSTLKVSEVNQSANEILKAFGTMEKSKPIDLSPEMLQGYLQRAMMMSNRTSFSQNEIAQIAAAASAYRLDLPAGQTAKFYHDVEIQIAKKLGIHGLDGESISKIGQSDKLPACCRVSCGNCPYSLGAIKADRARAGKLAPEDRMREGMSLPMLPYANDRANQDVMPLSKIRSALEPILGDTSDPSPRGDTTSGAFRRNPKPWWKF